jgi:two-component system, chemotaxis family, chemotaxis protein CheY
MIRGRHQGKQVAGKKRVGTENRGYHPGKSSSHEGREMMAPTESSAGDILLIEDDDSLGSILASVLQDQGYRVVLASNGREALHYLLTERPPRLILLNLVMPSMNGWKFREQLMRYPKLAEIPVIVLSGVRKLEKKAASLGATDSFTKPYNIKALVDTVQHYCQPTITDY